MPKPVLPAEGAEAVAPQRSGGQDLCRALLTAGLALFYAGAGVVHLAAPEPFLLITPDWVPWPRLVILLTGLCEIAGAAGLFVPRLRATAGALLALYAVCVLPANLKHALYQVNVPGLPSSWWYHGPRLLMQPVLVWAALFAGRVIDWPFSQKSR
jgi:uncharacterized membrane protein